MVEPSLRSGMRNMIVLLRAVSATLAAAPDPAATTRRTLASEAGVEREMGDSPT